MGVEAEVLWLREFAIQLNSIDPENTNYADLEPFRADFEGVRVVLLSHGILNKPKK